MSKRIAKNWRNLNNGNSDHNDCDCFLSADQEVVLALDPDWTYWREAMYRLNEQEIKNVLVFAVRSSVKDRLKARLKEIRGIKEILKCSGNHLIRADLDPDLVEQVLNDEVVYASVVATVCPDCGETLVGQKILDIEHSRFKLQCLKCGHEFSFC